MLIFSLHLLFDPFLLVIIDLYLYFAYRDAYVLGFWLGILVVTVPVIKFISNDIDTLWYKHGTSFI